MPTTQPTLYIPKTFRCSLYFQRRYQQRQQQQKLVLQRLTHRERLNRVSRHNCFGKLSILAGVCLVCSLVAVGIQQVHSWDDEAITATSVALLSWGLGLGLGISFVLVFAESSRHFRWASHIQTIDEELQEVDTIGTQEDAEMLANLSNDWSDSEDDDLSVGEEMIGHRSFDIDDDDNDDDIDSEEQQV